MQRESPQTQVFFTVDVEISMGGAWTRADWEPLRMDDCVYCRRGGREFGVRLIMDTLEAHGLCGVFFVDTAMHALGEESLFRDLCQEILGRGHDVQLHLHPGAMTYAALRKNGPVAARPPGTTDMIAALPEERQAELLSEARDVLAAAAGRPPVAFRAGNYSFSHTVSEVLARCGMPVDLSANLTSARSNGVLGRHNSPRRIGSVVELPVTHLVGHLMPGRGARPLEVNSIAAGEMCRALLELHRGGQRAAVLVFHSFSLMKGRSLRWENARLDRIVLERLRRLAEFLGRHRDQLPTARLSDCVARPGWLDEIVAGPDVWPTTTWPLVAARYAGQLISRL